MIDLRPDHLDTVQRILAEHVPECEVRAFGSRAAWTAKDYSDLDLAVVGAGPLDWRTLGRLKEAFEESSLPMRVDVLDWHAIAESFRQVIEQGYVVVQEGMNRTVASDWQRCEVSALINEGFLVIGDGYRAKNAELTSVGLPFARAGNIGNGFQLSGADCLPVDELHKVGEKISQPGDTVFTSKGTVGRFAFVSDEIPRFVYSPQLSYWRSVNTEVLEPRYLYYWMSSEEFYFQFKGVAGQTDMAEYVSLKDQRQMHITLPPLPEQRTIAHVLGTLDDKIELNRRMNETLEAMARALFKDWFVDFGPVRAKMAGREPYLPPDIWSLFPDRLVPSELGDIPVGWEVGTVGECYDLTMGQSPPGSTYNDDGKGTPFFQGSTDFGERYPTSRRYCTEPARLAQTEDTLVSVRAPVGAINRAWEQCCIGRGVAALRHKSGSAPYTYYAIWATQPEIGQYEHTGTVFGAIGGKQFRALKVLEPPDETVAVFHRIGHDLDRRIRSNVEESRSLAVQRDALLPSLASGDIRLGNPRLQEAVG